MDSIKDFWFNHFGCGGRTFSRHDWDYEGEIIVGEYPNQEIKTVERCTKCGITRWVDWRA